MILKYLANITTEAIPLLLTRLRVDRQTEIDGGSVEGLDGGVQIEVQWLVGIQRMDDANQMLHEVGVDLARAGCAATHLINPRQHHQRR